MTIDGVRLPADFLRLISEPFRRSGLADALGNRVIARHRAEFGLEIGLAVDAFARNPRIEEVGSKLDLGRRVGRERERAFEPMLADIAPRADDVGHDVDMHARGLVRCGGHHGGHGKILDRVRFSLAYIGTDCGRRLRRWGERDCFYVWTVTLRWPRSGPRRATATKSDIADLDNYDPKSQARFRSAVHPSRLATLAPQDDGDFARDRRLKSRRLGRLFDHARDQRLDIVARLQGRERHRGLGAGTGARPAAALATFRPSRAP